MDFPTLTEHGDATFSRVDSQSRKDFSFFWVAQGHDTSFRPGGLPPADWFISVNPYGFDDPEAEGVTLNDCFELDGPDVTLTLVKADVDALRRALWEKAQEDSDDHYVCDNGGAYVIWNLGNGLAMVGGFDNGGSDIAQTGSLDAAETCGEVVMTAGDSHFSLDSVLDLDYVQRIPRRADMLKLTQQLLEGRASKTPKRAP